MPTFIPPYLGEEIKSNAEKKTYDILQDLEMENTYVLHSLGLPKHQSKIYGEVDFVVVCDRGVACLEIKGGRIECREGQWIFKDRYDVEHVKAESPFAQVTGNMFSLREALRGRFPNHPHIRNLLAACGVVFPDIHFTSSSQEAIPEIIYDAETKSVTEYMQGIFDYWQERQQRKPVYLSPADIREIVHFLRGDFVFIPSLGSRLDHVEKRLLRLTSEQAQIMEALSMNDHLLVSGGAGTGKTLLAVDFALKQAAQGRKVLFLTYNKNLAHDVRCQIGEDAGIKIINIHALFGAYVIVDTDSVRKNAEQYFAEELPEVFYSFLQEQNEEQRTELQYDLLVMDEGQDILKPNYLYCLDCLLKGGFGDGKWAVFYDEKQNIYNPEYQEGMEILLSYPNARFRLFVNCRNTIQIGTYSAKVSGVESGTFLRENGEEVRKIIYANEEDFAKKIKNIIKELKKEQVQMTDVVFLSPNRYEHSLLFHVNIAVNVLGSKEEQQNELPTYATIQSFKGLDSKVVILFGMDKVRDDNFSKYIYIAGTRARTLLYIVEPEES
ncbi:MAG: NERD domain-containing protein [Eubacterium sp.]|nr:NERD domain-containing protein [Eubacterium sp.]